MSAGGSYVLVDGVKIPRDEYEKQQEAKAKKPKQSDSKDEESD